MIKNGVVLKVGAVSQLPTQVETNYAADVKAGKVGV